MFLTYFELPAGGLQAVCHDRARVCLLRLSNADWNSHERYGMGSGRLQVRGVREARRSLVASLLGGGERRNTPRVPVLDCFYKSGIEVENWSISGDPNLFVGLPPTVSQNQKIKIGGILLNLDRSFIAGLD